MSQGLYSGVSGLAIGVGLYKGTQGLWSGASGLITGDGGSTLSLNFLAGAPLDPRITFTRSSTATFVGSNGLIQTAAVDAPRFDYNPANLTANGLLIEEQRTNLLTYSEQFDNPAWTKATGTITANSLVSPDGATNADTYTQNIGTTGELIRASNYTVVADTDFSLSGFFKSVNGTPAVVLYATSGGNGFRVVVNLSTGATISSGAIGTGTFVSRSVTAFGNGWYRISVTGRLATGVTTGQWRMTMADLAGINLVGDGSKGIGLYGAQSEQASFPTSYIPTVASQVTRAADTATMTGTNFSSWYNQTEGTFVGSFDAVSPASTMLWAGISDGTSSNRMQSGSSSGSALFVNVGGVNQVALSSSAVTANTITNRAITYKTDDFAVCTSGGSVATDTLGTLPTVDRLAVGGLASGSQLNGHIRSLTYYPSRLPDATLQALTS